MRFSNVDFPVPLAPRMAIRESMLRERPDQLGGPRIYPSRYHALDTETQVLIQVVLWLSRIRESHVVERNDGRRQLVDVLEVES